MHTSHHRSRLILQAIFLVVVAVGLYGIVPQITHFHDSLQSIRHASIGYVVAAVLAIFMSYIAAAMTYYLLSFTKLRFKRTLLVELAGLFVNRVVPAGLGGLGLNYAYLRTNKHTVAQATSVVAINNLIGFVGHALLALIIIGSHPSSVQAYRFPRMSAYTAHVAILVTVVSLAALLMFSFYRRMQFVRLQQSIAKQLRMIAVFYRKRPDRLLSTIGWSCVLTLTNVLCLWFCCHALAIPLSFLTVFLVFTLGVALGTATPTPGGLGGTEAGLVAGLVASHVSAVNALAITLLFRFISFWLAMAIGALAFSVVRYKHYVHFNF